MGRDPNEGKHAKPCTYCRGTGQIVQEMVDRTKPGGVKQHRVTCYSCGGSGRA